GPSRTPPPAPHRTAPRTGSTVDHASAGNRQPAPRVRGDTAVRDRSARGTLLSGPPAVAITSPRYSNDCLRTDRRRARTVDAPCPYTYLQTVSPFAPAISQRTPRDQPHSTSQDRHPRQRPHPLPAGEARRPRRLVLDLVPRR